MKQNFPQTRIVARARNLNHWFQLRDREVYLAERELFESSLRSGRQVLELLGWPPAEARESAMRFRQLNIRFAEETHPLYKDRAQFIGASKVGRQQMEQQMAKEREARRQRAKAGWSDAP